MLIIALCAYEKHRIKNNLTSVPYDEGLQDFVKADYGKMSVESATAFNSTINELASEYDTPLVKIRTMTKDEYMWNRNSFAFVSHDYTTDSATLVINPIKCKDIEKVADRIKELSEHGYCVKIPDEVAERYIATHEFAHTLINLEQPLNNKTNWVNVDYDKIRNARKEINSVYEEYMKAVQTLTEKQKKAELEALTSFDEAAWKEAAELSKQLAEIKISDYSLESADEFMAEAFANEKIGVNSNEYAKKVLDILNKYFKG